MIEIKDIIETTLFAAEKHKFQCRKDKNATPYINHPLKIASILINIGEVEDQDIIKGALLHDTVEDTGTTPDELIENFGEKVANIVLEVTDDKSLPKEERKRLQVESASKKSYGAKIIKLADKISNLEDILSSPPADWSNQRKLEYFLWAENVFNGLRGTNEKLEARFIELLNEGKTKFQ